MDSFPVKNCPDYCYKPEKLRSVEDILAEIAALDQDLKGLEEGLAL